MLIFFIINFDIIFIGVDPMDSKKVAFALGITILSQVSFQVLLFLVKDTKKDRLRASLVGRTLTVILGIYGIVVVAIITSVVVNFYNEVSSKSKARDFIE